MYFLRLPSAARSAHVRTWTLSKSLKPTASPFASLFDSSPLTLGIPSAALMCAKRAAASDPEAQHQQGRHRTTHQIPPNQSKMRRFCWHGSVSSKVVPIRHRMRRNLFCTRSQPGIRSQPVYVPWPAYVPPLRHVFLLYLRKPTKSLLLSSLPANLAK